MVLGMISPTRILPSLFAGAGFAVLASCAHPQNFGTAPSAPVSSETSLANTGASDPDPGVKTGPVKIDTGIDPYADKKLKR